MPQVQRTEVDGVPVYWADEPGARVAAIQFRVGRADEPFELAGLTHAAEHLTFHQLGERPYPVNGFVDHAMTVFHASGRVDENAAFVTEVAETLAALDTDRLPDELRVLRVEASQRPPSVVDAHFTYRYGTEGPGRAALAEHGLHVATAEDVRRWSAERFTRGNAVAWLSFPPPAGFRLPLPDGERHPVGGRRPIEPLPLPSFAIAQIQGASLGGPIARTSAGAAGTRILQRRMERRLRRELGLSYEVSDAYVPLDGDEAFVSLYASCQDEAVARVAGEMVRLADEIAADGPSEAELARDVDLMERSMEEPQSLLGELARVATNDLLGHEWQPAEALLDELRAVRPADVTRAMEAFVPSLIGLAGELPELGGRWVPYPMWSAGIVAGRRFESSAKRFPWTRGTPVAVLGGDGVSLLDPGGQAVTVRFDQCAGVVRPDPKVRVLLGRDGFRVVAHADEWKDGRALVAGIDAAWPVERQVVLVD